MTRVMAEGDDALSVASALTGKVGQGPSDAIVSGGNVDRKIFCEIIFFFSSRRRHTRFDCDWSSDVCSSDLSLVQRHSFRRTRLTAHRASRVVTVSAHSKKDIMELYGVPAERIAVVYNAVSSEFYPVSDPAMMVAVKTRYGLRRDTFILSGGGSEPRKNIVRLVEAFGRATRLREKLNLVVVGGMDRGAEPILEAVRRARLEEAVIFPGHVPLEDLRVLYSSCTLFAFPSLYEGFGMPVLEAMACGAPVVSSNASSLPEVVSDAAVLVNPLDVEGLTAAMKRVVEDAGWREG